MLQQEQHAPELPSIMNALPTLAPPDEETLNLQELFYVLLRRRWIILGTMLLVLALGVVLLFLQRKVYQSTARILVSVNSSASSDAVPVISDLNALMKARSVDTQVEILTTPDVLDEAFNTFSPEERNTDFHSQTLPKWAVSIAGKRNTDVIEISARAYAPEAAARLANAIAATYFSRDLAMSRQATREARKYVEQSLVLMQQRLDTANQDLANFKTRYGLVAPDVQLNAFAEGLTRMQTTLDDASVRSGSDKQSLAVVKGQLEQANVEVDASTAFATNPRYAAIQSAIDTLNRQRAALLQEYTLESSQVKALDEQIADQQKLLASVAETIITNRTRALNPIYQDLIKQYASGMARLAADDAQVRMLRGALGREQAQAKALPERERQLTQLLNRMQLYQETYSSLTQKYHTLLISEQAILPRGNVISQARAAQEPFLPNTRRSLALCFLVALLLAGVVVVVIERMDDRVHDQETAERLAATVTVAGIPEQSADAPMLLAEADRNSVFLESFRVLRNNISFVDIDRSLRLLAITSSGPGEGKTTVSANLAMGMAMDGKRVLVVDCDLHRPNMHNLLKRSRDVGFTSVLTGASTLRQAIVPSDFPGVDFLPSGPLPPNPSEILNSQQSRQLFQRMAEDYDLVVIDCPPCVKLSDIQVLSTIADGLLLLVAIDRTLATGLRMAVSSLKQANAPLLGLIINRLNLGQQRYGYQYYYSSYQETAEEDGPQTGKAASRRKRKQTASPARRRSGE
ncbi:MAG TPA: polysaccharide biosynthesis tyrosine autokinase [Armatimonadota bacterium]|jgi:capsular exopolysaccharide synthesis family protein